MKVLKNLEPKKVFEYFEEISQIPRGSGNEKQISDYLVGVAKKLNLEVIQDEALNVIIKKPGTKGYENSPTVIIQGHMDMVCEKNKGVDHDFEKDPIKLRIIDDMIYATDTTLGADNGIAVAYALALLDSTDIPHPPLEILLTTDEETGMSGAMAVSREHLKGKLLINLDNEEEGDFLVSCSGGIRSKFELSAELEDRADNTSLVDISISGLKGGHSGMDIIKERGNSNKLLGRVLKNLLSEVDFRLVSLNGGSKDNAIPREADALIVIKESEVEKLEKLANKWQEIFFNELKVQDPGVKVKISEVKEEISRVFTKDSTEKAINLLYLIPNGIDTKSPTIKDLVQSSTNLGVVRTENNKVHYDSAIRSSVESLKEEIVIRSKTIAEIIGCKFETTANYPGWEYNPDSKLRELCLDVYKRMYGKDGNIVAIHAGVECGLFNEKLGGLDMISFGPDLFDVHTPEEHMSIKSVQNVWEYLKEVLKELK
ncbi:aminoacyl-histidine dipeptidase [Caproiciproducens sp. MSJ-32]|uniref:aminoacyl-histidine dipeptidase n=1 Tax=Caproiciproducens sp. MSJ-32 TaxID=2841527 RepID=UPI001C112E4C|nr:aminoacyl-histidine dipeptidase [Caproiciproducens sp. MSJ-32]MBU5455917.1 aminoacyl-histidine dipeptidase [Caproiciproducens sp. MSJ-32]